MPRPVRESRTLAAGVLTLALAGSIVGPAIAQAPPPAGRPVQAAADDPVVATYEGGQITKSEVLSFLGQYTIVPEYREELYTTAVNSLINQELFNTFLEGANVAVTAAELDAEVAKLDQQLQQSGQGSLTSLKAELGITETELRERLIMNLRWSKYLRSRGDDTTLRDYFEENKDLFTGTNIQASHILIRLDEEATEEDKQAAIEKLAGLKERIEAGEIEFAVAADEVSEDPSNQDAPDGGNIGYFARRGQVVDAFSDAAFALEVGEVSDPVETEYGVHLIKVTDRRAGQQDVTFEQVRDTVEAVFGEELRESIIEKARDQAKITIKPLPEDFFPAPDPSLAVPGAPGSAPPANAAPIR